MTHVDQLVDELTETRRPLAGPDEIATYLNVPKNTVYQWSSRGGGPRMFRVGRHLRARWDDLDAWLESRAVGKTSAA